MPTERMNISMSKKEKIEAQEPEIQEAATAEVDVFAEEQPVVKKDKATMITDLVELGRRAS